MIGFRAVTEDVYLLRYPVLDVNATLIVGKHRNLLIDTLSTHSQAAILIRAARRVSNNPVIVANTHAHFDHIFGNATVAEQLGTTQFWAQRNAVEQLTNHPEQLKDDAYRTCLRLATNIADEVRSTQIHVPNQIVDTEAELDLGGRTVQLWHPGPAHSTSDLVFFVDDVVVVGDLIEESGPPDTEGSALDRWPAVLDALLPYMTGPVIPGHGAVVDAQFARQQRDALAALQP